MKRSRVYLRLPTGGRCEDCDLRDALTLTGRPKRHSSLGYKLTGQCESCGGSGLASRTVWLDEDVLDKRLTPKQAFVMKRRLGIFDGHVYTQQEVADSMGVIQQAVSSMEARARERLMALAKKGSKKR